MWKEFFYYSRNEKRSIIVLLVLIVVVGAMALMLPIITAEDSSEPTSHFQEEYQLFVQSLQKIEQDKAGKSKQSLNYLPKRLQLVSFDPNKIDSIAFAGLGLPSWMIMNILKYRAKGGLFRASEDFAKVYGLKQEQYEALLPYITIDTSLFQQEDSLKALQLISKTDSFPKTVKYPEGTIVMLNHADTAQLKMIPGIGSSIAHRIVNYRQRLGGFYHLNQLDEINIKSKMLQQWLHVESDSIERMAINKMNIESLKRHPYINFYQSKVIVEHRKKRGNIKSLDELSLYDEFSATDLDRLKYYIRFD